MLFWKNWPNPTRAQFLVLVTFSCIYIYRQTSFAHCTHLPNQPIVCYWMAGLSQCLFMEQCLSCVATALLVPWYTGSPEAWRRIQIAPEARRKIFFNSTAFQTDVKPRYYHTVLPQKCNFWTLFKYWMSHYKLVLIGNVFFSYDQLHWGRCGKGMHTFYCLRQAYSIQFYFLEENCRMLETPLENEEINRMGMVYIKRVLNVYHVRNKYYL